jgi:hypothetical protein
MWNKLYEVLLPFKAEILLLAVVITAITTTVIFNIIVIIHFQMNIDIPFFVYFMKFNPLISVKKTQWYPRSMNGTFNYSFKD